MGAIGRRPDGGRGREEAISAEFAHRGPTSVAGSACTSVSKFAIDRRKVLSLGGAALFGLAARQSALAADKEPIRFALTPVLLTSDLDLLDRIKAYLEASTGRPVQLVTRRTYQEITTLLVSGQVDGAWICGYPFVAYEAQLALLAVPVWRGRPLYQSYLIADAGRSGANSIDDLAGDIHAFSDPDSNSGYLVTAAELAKKGQDAGTVLSEDDLHLRTRQCRAGGGVRPGAKRQRRRLRL